MSVACTGFLHRLLKSLQLTLAAQLFQKGNGPESLLHSYPQLQIQDAWVIAIPPPQYPTTYRLSGKFTCHQLTLLKEGRRSRGRKISKGRVGVGGLTKHERRALAFAFSNSPVCGQCTTILGILGPLS